MPLSKARDRERKRIERARTVQPKNDALQSKSRGVQPNLNTTAPLSSLSVQPKPLPNCPDGRYR